MKWVRSTWLVVVVLALLITSVASATPLMLSQFVDMTGTGLSVAEAGVGLMDLQTAGSKQIDIVIPGPVQAAYLFWAGRMDYAAQDLSLLAPPYPDEQMNLNGNPLTSRLVGYESQWPGLNAGNVQDILNIGYAADVTGIVQAAGTGLQSFVITDGDPVNNLGVLSGAGLIVLYTDPSLTDTYRVIGYEGMDFAFGRSDQMPDALITEPVIFNHGPAPMDRVAELIIFAGDAEPTRPDWIDITDAGGTTVSYPGLLVGSDGLDWDTLRFNVPVPTGGATTQAVLRSAPATGFPGSPDSLLWTVGLIRIPEWEYDPAALGDYVWEDLNGNGQQDAGEPGVEGVTVELYDCAGNMLASATTDATGFYMFSNLMPGCYQVQFMLPSGATWTTVDVGDDATDSDADQTTGWSQQVTLASGETNLTVDAGLVKPAALGDYVWEDLNGNGQQDAGEPGVEGVTVDLYDCAGNMLASTTTDVTGYYMFSNLMPGCYQVQFMLPSGATWTTVDVGDDATDSDADQTTGWSQQVTLAYGETNLTVDAGLVMEECLPCDGKVTWLTFQYLGDGDPAMVAAYQKKVDGAIMQPVALYNGDTFTVQGVDKKGTLGTELTLLVADGQSVTIHTSCSQPIGPGMVFGDFLVLAGASRNGGLLCPEETPPGSDCGECDGKVTWLQLEYAGDPNAMVTVYQKKVDDPIFDGMTDDGVFDFMGVDKQGTMGTEITIFVDGIEAVKIHTSCSQPIGPGMWFGDFYVLAGASRNGGLLCPEETPPPPPPPPPGDECGECDGKVTWLQLEYAGQEDAAIKVEQKKVEGAIFDDTVVAGGTFEFWGVDKQGTMGTEITIFVDSVEAVKIHTSCSQPIGPGMWFGDFYVMAGASRNGGLFCQLEP